MDILDWQSQNLKKMSKVERVQVAFANEQPQNLEVEVVSKWEPKNINRAGSHVFFSVDGQYVSMRAQDYKKIFE